MARFVIVYLDHEQSRRSPTNGCLHVASGYVASGYVASGRVAESLVFAGIRMTSSLVVQSLG